MIKNIPVFAAIISLGFILYFPSLFYELTFLDDHVWLSNLYWYLKDFSHGLDLFRQHDLVSDIFYRPLIGLSFMLNAFLGGQDPFVYHLTNILIHLFNSCLVFCLLKKFGVALELAFSLALIFTIHPALTQAVVWIPGRTDSLLALFSLLSFIFFIDYLHAKKWKYGLGHFIFLIPALLTKETALVLPFVCLAYFYLIFRREKIEAKFVILSPKGEVLRLAQDGSKDGERSRTKSHALDPSSQNTFLRMTLPEKIFKGSFLTLGWAIILISWVFIRGKVIQHQENINILSVVASLMKNAPALIAYIGKAILPFNLSVLPIREDTPLWYGTVAVISIIILIFNSKNKRTPHILFGLIWFFAFLWPSLIFSFLEHEYRLYLPLVGCFILLCELDAVKGLVQKKKQLFTMTAVITISFFLIAWNHSRRFQDRMTFWKSALQTSPHSPLAHRNLGAMYFLKGDLEKAEPLFRQSLKINPYEPMAHNNLGLIAARRGKFDEALQEYKMEIAINPDYDNVYYNLGLLYYAKGQLKDAEKAWEKTIELNGFYLDAYQRLIAYYLEVKDVQQADYYSRRLQKLNP